LIAELPDHVDGFVPTTQLSTSKLKYCNSLPYRFNNTIKGIEFDKESKKIVLSAIAALKEKSDEEIENYIKNFKLERVTVQNIRNAEMGTIDSSEFPIFEVPEPEIGTPKKKRQNKIVLNILL
jgi:hypothetical protein